MTTIHRINLNSELKIEQPLLTEDNDFKVDDIVKGAKRLARNKRINCQAIKVDPSVKATVIHRPSGLMGIISQAYSRHYTPRITPEDIWIMLMTQWNILINNNPEAFRHLFTASANKVELRVATVPSEIGTTLAAFKRELAETVNFDSNVLFPAFVSRSEGARDMQIAIFMEMGAPFFDYSTFCCGLPAVELEGELCEWQALQSAYDTFLNTFALKSMDPDETLFVNNTRKRVAQIVQSVENPETAKAFWMDSFTQKNIGSGRELEINGWLTEFIFGSYYRGAQHPITDRIVGEAYTCVHIHDLPSNKDYAIWSGTIDVEHQLFEQGILKAKYGSVLVEYEPKANM